MRMPRNRKAVMSIGTVMIIGIFGGIFQLKIAVARKIHVVL